MRGSAAIFSLGFLATRAEPALRVMGKTVETLSEGQFSQVPSAPVQNHVMISRVFECTYSIQEHTYGNTYAKPPIRQDAQECTGMRRIHNKYAHKNEMCARERNRFPRTKAHGAHDEWMSRRTRLTFGKFHAQTALVYTVCVGVGCGMVLGSSKILFGVK